MPLPGRRTSKHYPRSPEPVCSPRIIDSAMFEQRSSGNSSRGTSFDCWISPKQADRATPRPEHKQALPPKPETRSPSARDPRFLGGIHFQLSKIPWGRPRFLGGVQDSLGCPDSLGASKIPWGRPRFLGVSRFLGGVQDSLGASKIPWGVQIPWGRPRFLGGVLAAVFAI